MKFLITYIEDSKLFQTSILSYVTYIFIYVSAYTCILINEYCPAIRNIELIHSKWIENIFMYNMLGPRRCIDKIWSRNKIGSQQALPLSNENTIFTARPLF